MLHQLIVLLLILFAAFAHASDANLTWEEAKQRAAVVSNVDYDLSFEFETGSKDYGGLSRIEFDLKRVPESLFLDFQGEAIDSLRVNGRTTKNAQAQDNRIHLPTDSLIVGRNAVEVVYRRAFDTDGRGLHKVVDPADEAEYLFTQFQPFDANRLFPGFDQPDLRASYRIRVDAPADWLVITNGRLEKRETLPSGVRHHFARTQRFSTYIVALCAGPFAVWEDDQSSLPSRVLTTQALAEHMDADEIFTITRQGFDFFEHYFGIAYPFEKYDQIFVPQFGPGAMENVGAVIFNERYVYRHQPSREERMGRANTILHELAHMWFGNIVTMRWWNDLWLNESFATYMAYLSLVEGTEFTEAWDQFASGTKAWAYWQDQLPTTHPIETSVPDTRNTWSNFDGITYAKGAAAIKQLAHYVGAEPFREGVADYLKQHAWGNATRADFVKAIADKADTDLSDWTRLWLQTSGVNALYPDYSLSDDGNTITEFRLHQRPGNGDSELRPHRVQIGLYRLNGTRMQRYREVQATIDGQQMVVNALAGAAVPDFVYVNDQDHAYAKVYLDRRSLEFAAEHLEQLPVELRTGVWHASWFMTRDGAMSPADYLDLFLAKAALESDAGMIDSFKYRLDTVLNRYLQPAAHSAYKARVQALAWDAIETNPAHPDLQIAWFRYLLMSADTQEHAQRLHALLHGQQQLQGFELDQDKRWQLIERLAVLGHRDAPKLIERERLRDPGERGSRAAFRARVSLPDPEIKAQAWKQFMEDKDTPLNHLAAGMDAFFQYGQEALSRPYVERYFQALPSLAEQRGNTFARRFASKLFPYTHLENTLLARVETDSPSLPQYLRRILIEESDGIERALRIRGQQSPSDTEAHAQP